MEIWINGELVEFSLEQEQKLQDVVIGIEQFLQIHNYFLNQIFINGKELERKEVAGSSLLISNVERIDVSALGVLEKAREISEYLHMKLKFLLSLQEDELLSGKESVLLEIQEFEKTLDTLSNFLLIPFIYVFYNKYDLKTDVDELSSLTEILKEKIRDEKDFSQIFFSKVVGILQRIEDFYLREMLQVYELLYQNTEEYLKHDIFQALEERAAQIQQSLEDVDNVTTLFQMGDDAKAMQDLEKLLTLYEFVSQLVLRCTFLKMLDTEGIGEIQKKIQENILEIEQALVKKDIITLCDVLEYEYIPHLRELLELLPDSTTRKDSQNKAE